MAVIVSYTPLCPSCVPLQFPPNQSVARMVTTVISQRYINKNYILTHNMLKPRQPQQHSQGRIGLNMTLVALPGGIATATINNTNTTQNSHIVHRHGAHDMTIVATVVSP